MKPTRDEKKARRTEQKERIEIARSKCHKALQALFDSYLPMYVRAPRLRSAWVPDPEEFFESVHRTYDRLATDLDKPRPSKSQIENTLDLLYEKCLDDTVGEEIHLLFDEWKAEGSPCLELIAEIIAGCGDGDNF
jgi:hypothetical protein